MEAFKGGQRERLVSLGERREPADVGENDRGKSPGRGRIWRLVSADWGPSHADRPIERIRFRGSAAD
jgi:hypothetical protein